MEQPQSTPMLGRIYLAILLIIFVGVVVGTPLVVYLGSLLPDYILVLKAWKEILLLVAGLIAVVLVIRTDTWRHFLHDKLIILIGVYAALHLILWAIIHTGTLAGLSGLLIDLRYLLYFVLVYVAISLYPNHRHLFVKLTIFSAVAVFGFALLQVFVLPDDFLKYLGYGKDTIMPYLTVDQNLDFIRISSSLRGPNPLGAYAVIILSITVATLLKGRLPKTKRALAMSAVVVFGSLVALWASYSRSALVAAIVALVIILAVTIGRGLSRRSWIIAFVIVGALLGGLALGRDSDFVSNVILHEDPGANNAISSNEEHVDSLNMGLSRMIRQPFGAGVGSTGSASLLGDKPLVIENQYLFIAHEAGWLGAGLFVAIFYLVMLHLWQRRNFSFALGLFVSGIGLALIGSLLPVWVDDTVSLVWWGLAGATLATTQHLVKNSSRDVKTYNSSRNGLRSKG